MSVFSLDNKFPCQSSNGYKLRVAAEAVGILSSYFEFSASSVSCFIPRAFVCA